LVPVELVQRDFLVALASRLDVRHQFGVVIEGVQRQRLLKLDDRLII